MLYYFRYLMLVATSIFNGLNLKLLIVNVMMSPGSDPVLHVYTY